MFKENNLHNIEWKTDSCRWYSIGSNFDRPQVKFYQWTV